MRHAYLEIAATPAVKAEQALWGSRESYARMEHGEPGNDRLGPREAAFIAERDGFYLATVSETGWPYVQYRGGPKGFLHLLDERTLAFADLRGNRQHLTTGNLKGNDRAALFLMDYAHKRRLKLLARAEVALAADEPELAARLTSDADARVERVIRLHVAGFDWNCPQHITQRFTLDEVEAATATLRARLAAAEAELARRRAGA